MNRNTLALSLVLASWSSFSKAQEQERAQERAQEEASFHAAEELALVPPFETPNEISGVFIHTEETGPGCHAVLTRGEFRRVLDLRGTCSSNEEAIRVVAELMAEEAESSPRLPQRPAERVRAAETSTARPYSETHNKFDYRLTVAADALFYVFDDSVRGGVGLSFDNRLFRHRFNPEQDIHLSIPIEFRVSPGFDNADRVSGRGPLRPLIVPSPASVDAYDLALGVCVGFAIQSWAEADWCGKGIFRALVLDTDGGASYPEATLLVESDLRLRARILPWLGVHASLGFQSSPIGTARIDAGLEAGDYRPNSLAGIATLGAHLVF